MTRPRDHNPLPEILAWVFAIPALLLAAHLLGWPSKDPPPPEVIANYYEEMPRRDAGEGNAS